MFSSSNKQPLRSDLPADDVVEVRGALSELDPQSLEHRRAALKNMLSNSLARYDTIMSRRLPNLAPGVKVSIVRGPFVNQTGIVKEADYISERALITPEKGPAQWIRFGALGPSSAKD